MFSIQCEISEKDSQNHTCFLVGHGVEHPIAPWSAWDWLCELSSWHFVWVFVHGFKKVLAAHSLGFWRERGILIVRPSSLYLGLVTYRVLWVDNLNILYFGGFVRYLRRM